MGMLKRYGARNLRNESKRAMANSRMESMRTRWLRQQARRPATLGSSTLPTEYGGVGLLLEDFGGSFLVFKLLDGGPALGCGKFEVGQRIMSIDEQDIDGKTKFD